MADWLKSNVIAVVLTDEKGNRAPDSTVYIHVKFHDVEEMTKKPGSEAGIPELELASAARGKGAAPKAKAKAKGKGKGSGAKAPAKGKGKGASAGKVT